MSPDWTDPTFAMARQFPAPPCVVITAGTPCQLRVGGRLVSAMPIDGNSYPAGTQVKPLQLGPEWLFLPMSSKYPASYLEPLANWATKSQEALFMKYVLEQSNCRKLKVYSRGRVLAVLSEYLLSVACWDGVTRALPVDYMGKGTTGNFKAGDRCLVYDNVAQKIVIGFAGDNPNKEEPIEAIPGISEVQVVFISDDIFQWRADWLAPFPATIPDGTRLDIFESYRCGEKVKIYVNNIEGGPGIPHTTILSLKVNGTVVQTISIPPVLVPWYTEPGYTSYQSEKYPVSETYLSAWAANYRLCDVDVTWE